MNLKMSLLSNVQKKKKKENMNFAPFPAFFSGFLGNGKDKILHFPWFSAFILLLMGEILF